MTVDLNYPYLSNEDIVRLKEHPNPETKAEIAMKVGFCIDSDQFTNEQTDLACNIAMLLAKDKNAIVRQAIASAVRHSTKVPRKLIEELAMDEDDDVSRLVLKHSSLLTDEFLLRVIKATEAILRLTAVAQRVIVSEALCDALIEKNIEELIVTLIGNTGANLERQQYQDIASSMHSSEKVMKALTRRTPIPAEAMGMMVNAACDMMRNRLVQQKLVEPSSKGSLVEEVHSCLEMMADLGSAPTDEACRILAEKMNVQGQLLGNTLVAALMLGQSGFFAAGMAKRTQRTVTQALEACHGTMDQFRDLFQRSRLQAGYTELLYLLFQYDTTLKRKDVIPGTEEFVQQMVAQVENLVKAGILLADTHARPIARQTLEWVKGRVVS